jgi:hypothetical protein
VGGFHNAQVSNATDVKGILAEYGPSVGRGTLNVANNGLVSLIFPSEGTAGSDDLFGLVIGRFGRVNLGGDLGGGRIELTGGFESTGGTDDPDPLLGLVLVINDGVITGDGYIGTGGMLNRALGEIRVSASDRLVIDATAGFNMDLNPPVLPLQNHGLLHVVGSESARAELEFVGVSFPPANPGAPNEAFLNGRLTAAEIGMIENSGRTVGLIHAQHGTVRFRSGLQNQGRMSFTAGDNIVGGNVVNLGATGGGTAVGEGVITVSGNGTTVAFEDNLTNQGNITIDPGTFMSVLGNFGGTGTLNLSFGGGFSNALIGHIAVGGDAPLGGTLDVSLGSIPSSFFMAGDAFEILSTAGQLGVFATQNMPTLPGGLVMFPFYNPTAGTITLQVVAPLTIIGADFNGDGIVDLADLAILQANLGITMGALPQQGDSDLDGDVDGQDFLRWQGQVGGPGMPGAGSGSSAGFAANVPEPATYALAMCGLLALVVHRRRTR